MRALDIIIKKRNGFGLTRDEISFFIRDYLKGEIQDYQMSALLMAIYFKGMSAKETSYLTEEMMNSGEVFDLSEIPGIKVDKHSTGGVGDKVSLILAPLVASCGVPVPMVSGRGLGHSGGTLDKLESIPGFNTKLTKKEFIKIIKKNGFAMMGQTENFVPADKRMYALRDVTGTVESIPLISASIMSKKLAEGVDAIVFDVKTGSGAFMKTFDDSVALASSLVRIGTEMGRETVALITDMNQPLGRYVGNALEVKESIEVLNGQGTDDLVNVTIELGSYMLILGKKARDLNSARKILREKLNNGDALKYFYKMVEVQGGDVKSVKDISKLPIAKNQYELKVNAQGYIQAMETTLIGNSACILGAGRQKYTDVIDPAVGLIFHKKIGDKVTKEDVIVTIEYNESKNLKEAIELLGKAIKIGKKKVTQPKLIYAIIDKKGIRKF